MGKLMPTNFILGQYSPYEFPKNSKIVGDNYFYIPRLLGWWSGAGGYRIMGALGTDAVRFVRQSGGGSGDFPHHRRLRHVLHQYLRMLRVNT